MQTRLKLILLFSLLLGFTTLSSAKELHNSLSMSLVGMSMDYREYNTTGSILDSEKSSFSEMIGFELGYKFYFLSKEKSYSQIDVDYSFIGGETEYVGSILGSNNGYGSYVGTTNNNIADIDATYRFNYILNDTIEFNAGLGLGFRYWIRRLSSIQEEVYYWFSLRPSIGSKINIFKTLWISPVVEYQYAIEPRMSATGFGSDFKLGSADIIEI